MVLIDKPYSQIAYFVPDVRAAALEHHRTFGSGPFYVAENVRLPLCEYRGRPAHWNISSAFGQWGDVQVEFMQQDDDAASIFHDVYPAGSGRYGMHHLAFIVDDLWDAGRSFENQGHPIALHARMANGIEALLIDTIRSETTATCSSSTSPLHPCSNCTISSAANRSGSMARPGFVRSISLPRNRAMPARREADAIKM